ncbi:YkvA family protein [Aurantimonas coralicida]|uniref:YkvA family protein n=1 Tax=Aurantimonas coralicida TaxID=182270 RepID=UPI003C6CA83C
MQRVSAWMSWLTACAGRMKREVLVLWVAARDRRTPWAARMVAFLTAAYALSPIDLIPDVIPVLGYLDDLVIVPLGVWLALRLIPDDLVAVFRVMAMRMAERPLSRTGLVLVLGVWLIVAIATLTYLRRVWGYGE